MLRIIVPIKQVPETSNVRMDPETGTMIRLGLEAIINPLDLYALETALRIKENQQAHISVISMGPLNAEDALREALALGCDDAVLLSHKAFRGADTWATSYTLSQAIKKLGKFDLLICGERATDGETGQVGPGIAAFLNLPLVTYVRKISEINPSFAHFERLVEGGVEIINSEMPAAITVVKEIANPRLPTLRGIKAAKGVEIPIWGPEEIEADPMCVGLNGSPTRVVKIQSPQVTRSGTLLNAKTQGEMEQAAEKLISYLQEKNLLNWMNVKC